MLPFNNTLNNKPAYGRIGQVNRTMSTRVVRNLFFAQAANATSPQVNVGGGCQEIDIRINPVAFSGTLAFFGSVDLGNTWEPVYAENRSSSGTLSLANSVSFALQSTITYFVLRLPANFNAFEIIITGASAGTVSVDIVIVSF